MPMPTRSSSLQIIEPMRPDCEVRVILYMEQSIYDAFLLSITFVGNCRFEAIFFDQREDAREFRLSKGLRPVALHRVILRLHSPLCRRHFLHRSNDESGQARRGSQSRPGSPLYPGTRAGTTRVSCWSYDLKRSVHPRTENQTPAARRQRKTNQLLSGKRVNSANQLRKMHSRMPVAGIA